MPKHLPSLQALVDAATLADSPPWLHHASEAAVRQRALKGFTAASVYHQWPRNAVAQAAVAVQRVSAQTFGFEARRLHLLADPLNPPAMDALQDLIALALEGQSDPLFCEPPWGLRRILPVLQKQGLGLDGLRLIGQTDVSLRRLRPPTFPEGYQLRQSVPAEWDELLALRARYFQRSREAWSWYVGTPTDLRRMRQRLAHPDARCWTLLHEDRGVGYIHTAPNHHSPILREVHGLDLLIDAPYQRRGFLRPLMQVALQDLHQRGIPFYSGVTSNPAVLHVGHSLGRVVQQVMMRSAAPFCLDDFSPYDLR